MSALDDARAALAAFDRAGTDTVLSTVPAVIAALRELLTSVGEGSAGPATSATSPTEPTAKTWDRVHNRPADIYTPPEDRVAPPDVHVWTDARIREAFIYDGGEAAYHDPISGDREQRRVAGAIFDAWLSAHDAEVRRQGPITDAHDAELRAAYPEVDVFAARMREELWSNRHKGDHAGWRSMTLRQAWGEIAWHVGKMAGALKAEDVALIRELAADVANGAMMLDDILLVSGVADVCRCGVGVHDDSPGCAWHEQREAARAVS